MPMSINRSKPVVDILTRAGSDAAFRGQLLNDPSTALAGYSLNFAEKALLSNLTPQSLEAMIKELS